MFALAFLGDIFLIGLFTFGEIISRELHIFHGQKAERKHYKTMPSFRKLHNFTRLFRCLQILLEFFTNSVGILFPVSQVILFLLGVYCQVCLTTQWHQMGKVTSTILLASFICSMVMWTIILDILGRMQSNSRRMIGSWMFVPVGFWGSHYNMKYIKQFQRSCKPLVVNYVVFGVKKGTVFKFVETVSRSTFRALVAVREY